MALTGGQRHDSTQLEAVRPARSPSQPAGAAVGLRCGDRLAADLVGGMASGQRRL